MKDMNALFDDYTEKSPHLCPCLQCVLCVPVYVYMMMTAKNPKTLCFLFYGAKVNVSGEKNSHGEDR